jgi:hypothetical protein
VDFEAEHWFELVTADVWVPRVNQQLIHHLQHHSRFQSLVLAHSDMPVDELGKCHHKDQSRARTWIRFFPSALVTSGWSFGVVNV